MALIFAASNLKRYGTLFGLPHPGEARQLFDATHMSMGGPTRVSLWRPPHTLPAQVTSLIGRESEVADLHALLASKDARLVTLTGPGGVG